MREGLDSFIRSLPSVFPKEESRLKTRLPRGIRPTVLLQQIRNTAPFIFADDWTTPEGATHIEIIRQADAFFQRVPEGELFFDHYRYFELCVAAHHTTVGTFVPTDVDNQIRFKLWSFSLPLETVAEMANFVLESFPWDEGPTSARVLRSPETGGRLSGHQGEWFSTAVASYGALRKRLPKLAAQILAAIVDEVAREAQLYREYQRAKDGIGMLKAATVIAHNLGDLDRVVDMWNMPEDDPLRTIHKAGHAGEQFGGVLAAAGDLNKAYMAVENHRHFALRIPRGLRRYQDLLLPIAPFLDEWGAKVAKHPGLSPREVGEVAEALIDGWDRLPGTVGYARAMAGIEENFPGGLTALSNAVPAKVARRIKTGAFRTLCSVPRHRFEGHWNQAALKFSQ